MGSQQGKNKTQIIITGLDNSGKSTIIPHLKPNKYRQKLVSEKIENNNPQQSISTISANQTPSKSSYTDNYELQIPQIQDNSIQIETFTKERLGGDFIVFDLKSQNSRHRSLWESFYEDANGIVFVIDASDRLRMQVVKNELDMLLDHQDIKGNKQPILFLANKVEKPQSMNEATIVKTLKLDCITDRTWNIRSCSALSGEGVFEAFLWLRKTLKEQKKKNRKDMEFIGHSCVSRNRSHSVGRSLQSPRKKNSSQQDIMQQSTSSDMDLKYLSYQQANPLLMGPGPKTPRSCRKIDSLSIITDSNINTRSLSKKKIKVDEKQQSPSRISMKNQRRVL